jgi:hypothetical protein
MAECNIIYEHWLAKTVDEMPSKSSKYASSRAHPTQDTYVS